MPGWIDPRYLEDQEGDWGREGEVHRTDVVETERVAKSNYKKIQGIGDGKLSDESAEGGKTDE